MITKYVPKLTKSAKRKEVIHFKLKTDLKIKIKNNNEVKIKPIRSSNMAKNSIERKAKKIPFLFAPGAQNSIFPFNFLDSNKIRIENMANAIPVIKGKNPE